MSYTRIKPRYSVMRIERAKQAALTGESFKPVNIPGGMVMDWNGDDEEALCNLIGKWNKNSNHAGLNALIDEHQFSHGTNYVNSGLKRMVEEGRVVDSFRGGKCHEKILVRTNPDGSIHYETRHFEIISEEYAA